MLSAARGLTGIAGLLLLATAYLHYTGTAMVQDALNGTDLSQFFLQGLPTIWMVFSWHLIVVAIPLLFISIYKPDWLLPITAFFGVVTFGDFLWVFSVTGWFSGTFLLISAVISLLVSAVIQWVHMRS